MERETGAQRERRQTQRERTGIKREGDLEGGDRDLEEVTEI